MSAPETERPGTGPDEPGRGGFDTRVWRVLGDPLVAGAAAGPLAGERVAVKDLYAVAGHRVGAGNPSWLEAAEVETGSAWAVQRLLDAGADVAGIARTDEFAYSLAGTNAHYGSPPNPQAPHRISGGSSSGSASAVSLGQATIGLGTDTGGSIRVPAAYQGLWGVRTSTGAVPVGGLLPLAPSFDAVGWLAPRPDLLKRVGDVLLPDAAPAAAALQELALVPALLALAEPDVAEAVDRWALEHDAGAVGRMLPERSERIATDVLGEWLAAFQRVQAWEAWQCDGRWLAGRLDTLGTDVRARFETASRISDSEAERERGVLATARAAIHELVGDRVLVLPSASSVAPLAGPGLAGSLQSVRDATMRLTCVAGIGGLPAVNVPLVTAEGLPCGACLVAAPGRDRELLALAERLASDEEGPHPSHRGNLTSQLP